MAVRKQRRMKTLKGRTVTVKNRSHWEKILSKMGDRLLIVHYSAVRSEASLLLLWQHFDAWQLAM